MNLSRFGRTSRKAKKKTDGDDILSDRYDPDYRFEDLVDGYEEELFDENGKAVVTNIEAGRSARLDRAHGSGADRLAAIARDAISSSASATLGKFLSGAVIGVLDTAVADMVAAIPEAPTLDDYADTVRAAIEEALDAYVAPQTDGTSLIEALEGHLADQSRWIASRLVEFAEALPPSVEPAELETVRRDLSTSMAAVVERACADLAYRVETEFVDKIAARIDAAADETVRRLAVEFSAATGPAQMSLDQLAGAVEVAVTSAIDGLPAPATIDQITALLDTRPAGDVIPVSTLETVLLRLLGHAPNAASSGLVTAGFEDVDERLSKLGAQLARIIERVESDRETRRVLGALEAGTQRSDRRLIEAVDTIERKISTEADRVTEAMPVPPTVEEVSRHVVADLSSILAGSVIEITSTVTTHVDRAIADGTLDSIRDDIADVVSTAVAEHLGPDVVGEFEERVKLLLSEADEQRGRRGRRR